MQRFYFEIELWENITIDDKDFFHQISHVLRSVIWDKVNLFNWDSYDYIYSISEIKKNQINLKFCEKIKNNKDADLILNLYQSIPNKYEKVEYILQKWVEIGIRNFIFFQSERSQKLIINEKKLDRFKFIIKESLEQCGWCILPEIRFISKLDLWKINWEKIVCHTNMIDSIDFKKYKIDSGIINLFIWPEGWFSEKEISDLKYNWAQIINFWERVLRTETTWVVVGFYFLNR